MEHIYIGNVSIEKTAALAPMASVADFAFRSLCKEYGACYMVGEMVSAKGLVFQKERAADLLKVIDFERPMAIQLFGSEPEYFPKAVEIALCYNPDIIDINMGCPVPKVVSQGSGSALLKNPELAAEIVKQTVKASTVPVTVKIRLGWDETSKNAVEFAKRMENTGSAAITVHGSIAEVKEAVSIPVIGNGDITSPELAKEMYDITGVDLVMIGRGAYGRPWLFSQIKEYLENGRYSPDPDTSVQLSVLHRHISLLCKDKGEYIGMKEARAQAARYFKGMSGASAFRARCSRLTTFSEFEKALAEFEQKL